MKVKHLTLLGYLSVADAMWNGRPCSSMNWGGRSSCHNGLDRYYNHNYYGRRNRRCGGGGSIGHISDIFSIPFTLNSLFNQHYGGQIQRGASSSIEQPQSGGPRYDILEDDKTMELLLDVPGIRADDISIELQRGGEVLKVSGTRRVRHYGRGRQLYSSEFDQMFSLDRDMIDVEKMSVTLEDGLLRISAPKRKRKRADRKMKKIPIVERRDEKVIETRMSPKLEEVTKETEISEDAKVADPIVEELKCEEEEKNVNPLVEGLEITEEEEI